MNHSELKSRLKSLVDATHLEPASVDRFAAAVAELKGADAVRINPLQFAAQHGLAPAETSDLFVAASKAGIFDFEWNHVCPACGAIQSTRESLDLLHSDTMRCELCDIDVTVALDDQVEVTFCLNASVKHASVDPFSSPEAYQRHFFSNSFVKPPELMEYLHRNHIDFYTLPAGRSRQVQVQFAAGEDYRLVSLDTHSVVELRARPEVETTAVTVELGLEGVNQAAFEVKSGVPIHLHLHNMRSEPVAFLLMRFTLGQVMDILQRSPIERVPFLSAKMLLNSQMFRDMYRVHSLNSALHLNLRSLTLLFTDLKGSTALYDRVGDLEAYRLIQAHFKVLGTAVRRHSGAIIKTMGDAIMASFSTPEDAIEAAIDMIRAIDHLNASVHQNDALGLKVGLHEGPAVAIHADHRVDYFGQTVNIAARVQGLADAGEIVLTDTLYRATGVAERLRALEGACSQMDAHLKGVSHTTAVHRYSLSSVPEAELRRAAGGGHKKLATARI